MDSLSEAIDYYARGKEYSDERCYKFCIFLLYHSAELILKEILNREHKVFIYEKIEDYFDKKILCKPLDLERLWKEYIVFAV